MIQLGDLFRCLITICMLGAGSLTTMKFVERKIALLAVEAHKSGPISMQAFHRKLVGHR